jgi:hypothetical protein
VGRADQQEGLTMTSKSDFSEDEWARIIRAPFVAGMAITLADPGGPIEAAKESMASMRSATKPPSREQLLTDIALDIQAELQQRHNPAKGYRPTAPGSPPGEQILEELRTVHALVATKATPEETAAFGAWLVSTAQDAANAAKEGGFMGFHAERVSQRETDMIEKVREAVGAAPAAAAPDA